MVGYQTEQKKLLIDFLLKHSEKSFTIVEIAEGLSREAAEVAPGLSTVYRLIPKLVEEGLVKRFPGNQKRRFLYQIVGGEHCAVHFHMKCTGCGKLLHMNNNLSQLLLENILNASRFRVDQGQTVLFGRCGECAK